MPTKSELEETLKGRIARIDQMQAELTAIEKKLDDYINASLENSDEVGRQAIYELESLARLSGPYEALAYARRVFEMMGSLIDPDENIQADRVCPSEGDRREFMRMEDQRQKLSRRSA